MNTKKIDSSEKMSMKDLAIGSLLEPCTARQYETGGWRSERPVWIQENCIQCLFCWIDCPDAAVVLDKGQMAGFNYKHCKGCGICAKECPGKKGNTAIKMVSEKELKK